MKKRILAAVLCAVMCLNVGLMFSSCGGGSSKPDALVIMTEDCDGLFNPFFSTTGADSTIVGMTQISMLTTGYENGEVVVACGDDEAVVVKDYNIVHDTISNRTVYTFVIKNGITFSDGKPLTMHDVLFNLYVYLDPVYTGSSTMYSTDIVGLQAYRTQKEYSGDNSDADSALSQTATGRAQNRINELINVFRAAGAGKTPGSYSADYDKMVSYIKTQYAPSLGFKEAIAVPSKQGDVSWKDLLDDYERTLQLFREELNTDYASAKDAYTENPYKATGEFDEVTSFMYAEGMVTLEYAEGPDGKKDKTKITEVKRGYPTNIVVDKESAIEYVFNTTIETKLDQILTYWATAQKLITEYTADAKTVLLHETIGEDGRLAIPNITGIVSLGHTGNVDTVKCLGGEYTVAKEHNADGTVATEGAYDVLQITINGVDPKAIWNFAFAVAPQHYYAPGYEVDIPNNKFGVQYGTASFMQDVIQSPRNVKVPMGAGAYMATNKDNGDNPDGNAFFSNNVVYFKANKSFLLGEPKIEKVRYQVVSASNALSVLETGAVHFVTPQFTQANIEKINGLASNGIEKVYTDQLGYGYIGINAGEVPDINLRRAIMTAMNTSLALSYYSAGMADTIYYPMSTVSWAYPGVLENGQPKQDNSGHSYISLNWNREAAKAAIENYMLLAGVSADDKALEIDFTIAGANLTDHPTYNTFLNAAELLNECGWSIEVIADTQALTKLSTGSLAVWAAAWGSTIDPDLYQVYHKNSTATSTTAWGYREILNNPLAYPEETQILNELSNKIDDAREIEDKATRAKLYEEALQLILDLAVEMPVYQRKVLYAYNANVINKDSLPAEINPYTSPLDHIWEIEFAE